MNGLNLPPRLAKYTGEDRLRSNAERYPEMQEEPSPQEQLGLEAVKHYLLQLPLSHTTSVKDTDKFYESGVGGYEKTAKKTGEHHNTLPLDESLGLSDYVFMHFGGIQKMPYGRSHILFNQAAIIHSPNTVVTPYDLNATAFRYMQTPAHKLDEQGRQVVESYLDTMVTGSDWLEILSRRALQKALQHDEEDFIYKITSPAAFGEVKHYGSITPDLITDVSIGEESEHQHWRNMLASGFSPSPVSHALEMEQRGLPSGTRYNLLPEELGIQRSDAHAAWAHVLAIAR